MIKFACTCHTILEVSDEFAGTSLQCPTCKRLVDVPTLSDLRSLDEEGTYKLDAPISRHEPNRLEKLHRAFTTKRVDERGQPIDLRAKFGSEGPMGDADVLEVLDDPAPPKYDPETGERVRSVPLKHEPVKFDPSTIPVAKAVINYASGSTAKEFHGGRIFAEIFRFENVFVMSMIFGLHICLQLVMIPMLAGMFIVFFGPLALIVSLLGHYSNVVDETGVEANDELPRPLRNLSWTDDIGGPFFHMVTALLICYGPALFFHRFPTTAQPAYVFTVLVFGTIFFPAVFLTTATSGTILNLAPDRVLRVIATLGLKYFVAIVIWALAGSVYVVGVASTMIFVIAMVTSTRAAVGGVKMPLLISYAILGIGIVLMHGFCWYLGLQYRAHHDQFDWFYQRHHRKLETVQPPGGTSVTAPSIAPPMATAIAPPRSGGDYPQSHA